MNRIKGTGSTYFLIAGILALICGCGGSTNLRDDASLRGGRSGSLGRSTSALDDCSTVQVCTKHFLENRYPAVKFASAPSGVFIHAELYYDTLGCTGSPFISEGQLGGPVDYVYLPDGANIDMSARWRIDQCDITACTDYTADGPPDCDNP